MTDMYRASFFDANHVESEYNRSDPGTKVCSSVVEQDWFRSLLGLQWPRDHPNVKQRDEGRRGTNGVAPPKHLLKPHDPEKFGSNEAWQAQARFARRTYMAAAFQEASSESSSYEDSE